MFLTVPSIFFIKEGPFTISLRLSRMQWRILSLFSHKPMLFEGQTSWIQRVVAPTPHTAWGVSGIRCIAVFPEFVNTQHYIYVNSGSLFSSLRACKSTHSTFVILSSPGCSTLLPFWGSKIVLECRIAH